MKFGKIQPQEALNADVWQKIYETTLTEAADSVTISGLDGDTDIEYFLIIRIVGAVTVPTNPTYYILLNNDSGSNYCFERISGDGTDALSWNSGATNTGIPIGMAGENETAFGIMLIHAKSGYDRTGIANYSRRMASTTVVELIDLGFSWDNSADNLTSIKINSQYSGGIGIGTIIELYKKTTKV